MAAEDPYDALIESPVGLLGIRLDGDVLTGIDFLVGHCAEARETPSGQTCDHPVIAMLNDYFVRAKPINNIKIMMQGTEYQKKVWQQLQRIPVGQTWTYGELAQRLNSSARAVGNACRRNPLPIVVPCHRVVSANGAGGFMGATRGRPMSIKHWLLQHEQDA